MQSITALANRQVYSIAAPARLQVYTSALRNVDAELVEFSKNIVACLVKLNRSIFAKHSCIFGRLAVCSSRNIGVYVVKYGLLFSAANVVQRHVVHLFVKLLPS